MNEFNIIMEIMNSNFSFIRDTHFSIMLNIINHKWINDYNTLKEFIKINHGSIMELRRLLREEGYRVEDIILERERYFQAKKKGKSSYIKKLYKDAENAINRKQRRKILFIDIPKAREEKKIVDYYPKEKVKNFYVCKYIDELRILFSIDYFIKEFFLIDGPEENLKIGFDMYFLHSLEYRSNIIQYHFENLANKCDLIFHKLNRSI